MSPKKIQNIGNANGRRKKKRPPRKKVARPGMPLSPGPQHLLHAMKAGAKKRQARKAAEPLPPLFRDDPSSSPLAIALSAAVPLRVAEYRARGGPSAADYDRVRGNAELVASGSDGAMYRGNRKGHAAKVFAAIADALAVMAFCPGGVRFCGSRYEATRPTKETPL